MNKKIFLFLFLGLFMVSFASAFDWYDNSAISYYELDEVSGTVIDSVGSNTGTNNGATTNVEGIINTAYEFDGSSDNIDLGDIDGTAEMTIQAWVNSSASSLGVIVAKDSGTTILGAEYRIYMNTDGTITGGRNNNAGGEYIAHSTGTYNDGDWHHVVLIMNSTNNILYIDGVEDGDSSFSGTPTTTITNTLIGRRGSGSTFDGRIDEVGFWNKTLTPSEILELYNAGDGLPYGDAYEAHITLEYPTDGLTISDVGANFTVSGNNLSSVSGTWQNVTYFVWDNSSLVNSTTVSLSGEIFNETLFIDNFMFESYFWNAEACFTNSTASFCVSSVNRTFDVSLFTIISESYVNDTVSGTLENFSISIDLLEGYNLLDAIFIYNGTENSPNIIAEGDNRFLLVSDYQIPISITDQNISFYWDMTFTGDISLNSTNRTQLVRSVLLDNCSTYTNQIFNISLFDEELKTSLLGDIEIIYTLLNMPAYQTINTYSFKLDNVSNVGICSGVNLTEEDLAYSAEIRYVSDGYAPELYHIQRAEVGDNIQSINLFDLNNNESTEFKLTYQDDNFNFVEGAIVQLQRKYISEDVYEVVEAPLTSRDGVAVVHVDLDSIKYKATVVKDGIVLDVFDNLVFKCQSELTGECEQKLLGAINPQNEIGVDTLLDFYYELSGTDDNITTTFTIPSGAPSSVNILMIQKDEYGNKSICNKTIVSSSGSITCEYSETLGDSYIDILITKDGVPMVRKSYLNSPGKNLDWLGNNYIFIVVILFSLVGMALSSPEWIIINGILTMVICGALFLAGGLDFVAGLGSIMWLIIAAIILISKISKQEDR